MPQDMSMTEGFFAFIERRDAEDKLRVTLAPALAPLSKEMAEDLWLSGALDEPTGPTPEEWAAAEALDFGSLDAIDPGALLRVWQDLHHGRGMTGEEAAGAVFCAEPSA